MIAACLILLFLVSVAAAQPVALVRAVQYGGNGNNVGSATLIALDDEQAVWLTARHVTGRPVNVYVQPHGHEGWWKARHVIPHSGLDVAVVVTLSQDVKLRPIRIADSSGLSSPAVISGYSYGSRFEGRSASWRTYDATGREGIWRGVAISGQSGGPIFSRKPFQLLGVVSGSGYGDTVGPCCTPIRSWLRTLGWRFRRARAQAREYSQLQCPPSGDVRINYGPRPGTTDGGQVDDEPPMANPYGPDPVPDPVDEDEFERRLQRVENSLAKLPTSKPSEIEEHTSQLSAHDTQLQTIVGALQRLSEESTKTRERVDGLSNQLEGVMSDLKRLNDDLKNASFDVVLGDQKGRVHALGGLLKIDTP